MGPRAQRRTNGIVGGILILLTVGFLALFGTGILHDPTTVLQAGALLLAGTLDVVAALDTPVTERVAWYRLSGLANVLLGVALPLGVAASVARGDGSTAFLVLMAIGGVSIAALGLDVLVFRGEHIYAEPLD